MERIDAAALDAARGDEGLAATVERFLFFNEVLVWHAHGEELAIFPVLEDVAPLVAEAYVKDHRGLDSAFNELSESYASRDPLTTARATAAFRFHLNIHLGKDYPSLSDFHRTSRLARTREGCWYHVQHDSPRAVSGSSDVDVPADAARRS